MDEPPKHGTLRQAVERSRRRNRRRRYQQWRTCIQKMPPRLTWTVLLELGSRPVINSDRTGWRRCPRKPNFSRPGPARNHAQLSWRRWAKSSRRQPPKSEKQNLYILAFKDEPLIKVGLSVDTY